MRALPLAAGINVVAIVLGIIFLLSFFWGPYFATRKGAGRVLQFCMGSLVIKILGFQSKKLFVQDCKLPKTIPSILCSKLSSYWEDYSILALWSVWETLKPYQYGLWKQFWRGLSWLILDRLWSYWLDLTWWLVLKNCLDTFDFVQLGPSLRRIQSHGFDGLDLS